MGRFGQRKTVSLKSLSRGNGRGPRKPSLAGVVKKPLPKKQNARDFYVGGMLFWNAKILGEVTKGYKDGVFRPYGSVDVSNGDQTYTLHNMYGSWMAVMSTGMAEPARIAAMLGTNMGQLEMYQNLQERFRLELKHEGVPSVHDQRRRVEEAQKAARARAAKPAAPKTTTKITLKGLKK
jgi:hypothetical protein